MQENLSFLCFGSREPLNLFECDKYHAKPNEFLTSPSKKINQAELFSPICIFFQGNSIRSRKSIRSAVKSSEIILKDDDSQLFAPFYDRDADGRLNSRFPSWKMSPQGSIAVYWHTSETIKTGNWEQPRIRGWLMAIYWLYTTDCSFEQYLS